MPGSTGDNSVPCNTDRDQHHRGIAAPFTPGAAGGATTGLLWNWDGAVIIWPQTSHEICNPVSSAPKTSTTFIASIDTMKVSRDTWQRQLSPGEIRDIVNLFASLHTNSITADTHWDYLSLYMYYSVKVAWPVETSSIVDVICSISTISASFSATWFSDDKSATSTRTSAA